jgi:very-short-patch-repair endonuclease
MWELPVPASASIHVTVPHRVRRVVPSGVRVHRVSLTAANSTTLGGMAITTRTRTIVDLLRLERYELARTLFDRAIQPGWITVETLETAIRVGPGRTGNVQLRRLADGAEPGAHAESEQRLHSILKRAGLGGWVPQYRVQLSRGFAYIDAAFPEQLLAIEVDGRRCHDESSDRFETDRTRQNELIARGWRVLRFTWRSLNDEPAAVLARISEVLAS